MLVKVRMIIKTSPSGLSALATQVCGTQCSSDFMSLRCRDIHEGLHTEVRAGLRVPQTLGGISTSGPPKARKERVSLESRETQSLPGRAAATVPSPSAAGAPH